jgi:ribonuclease BN (tRNA processing enzyme)
LHAMACAFAPDDPPEAFYSDVFDVSEYDPDQTLTVGSLVVTFAPTVHYVPAWAMRIASTRDGGTIGYTADTGPAAHIDDLLGGCQLLVAEATLLEPDDAPFASRGHLTAAETGELATRVGASKLLITHLWEEFGFANLRDAAAARFAHEVVVAKPGLSLST